MFNISFGRETGDKCLFEYASSKLAKDQRSQWQYMHTYWYVRTRFDGCLFDIFALSSASSFASCVNRNPDFSYLSAKSPSANQN